MPTKKVTDLKTGTSKTVQLTQAETDARNQEEVNALLLNTHKWTRLYKGVWVMTDGVLSVDMVEAKKAAHKIRSKWRDWKESQDFMWRAKMFSSDRDSANRIDREYMAAKVLHQRFVDDPVTYPTDYLLSPGWKATDDTFEGPLTFTEMEDFFLILRQHHVDVFTESETYSAQINGVADIAVLTTVVNTMITEAGIIRLI